MYPIYAGYVHSRLVKTFKDMMKKILIVEDDKNILNALQKYFQRKEYKVVGADNVVEAIKIFEKFTPELLITDWKLKDDFDGVDLVRMIRNEKNDMAVIFITGHNTDDLKNKLSDLRVDEVIKKPFELATIDAAVKTYLN